MKVKFKMHTSVANYALSHHFAIGRFQTDGRYFTQVRSLTVPGDDNDLLVSKWPTATSAIKMMADYERARRAFTRELLS